MVKKGGLPGIIFFHCFFAGLLFALTYLVFGSYFERSNDGINASQFAGVFTGGESFYDFYYIGYLGLARIYAFLYDSVSHNFPWYSVAHYLYSFLATVCIFTSIYYLLRQCGCHRFWIAAVQFFFFWLIIADSVVNHCITSTGILLSGVALLALHLLVANGTSGIKWVLYSSALVLLFTIGFYTRLASGGGALCVLLGFSVIYGLKPNQLLKLYLPVAAVTGLTMLGIHLDWRYTDKLYKKIEPHIVHSLYIVEGRKNVVDISAMKTERDSMKYHAVMNGLISDPENIDYPFLKSLVVETSFLNFLFFDNHAENLQRTFTNLQFAIHWQQSIFFINLIFAAAALFFLFDKKKETRQVVVRFLLFQLFFWFMIFYMTFSIKIVNRVFSPLLCIYSLCNLVFFVRIFAGSAWMRTAALKIGIAAIALILMGSTLKHLHWEAEELKRNDAYDKSVLQEMDSIAAGKILVISFVASEFFFISPFETVKFPSIEKLMVLDGGEFTLVEQNKKYLEKTCHCYSNRLVEPYRFLQQNKDKVIYVSDEKRVCLIEHYLKVMYDFDIKFMKVEGDFKAQKSIHTSDKVCYFTVQ